MCNDANANLILTVYIKLILNSIIAATTFDFTYFHLKEGHILFIDCSTN